MKLLKELLVELGAEPRVSILAVVADGVADAWWELRSPSPTRRGRRWGDGL
jgi:hypothetical protein